MSNFNKVGTFMKTFGQEVKNKASFSTNKINSLRYDLIKEELEELKVAINSGNQSNIEEEAGDLLFSVVSLSRHTSVDPESALRKANKKFDQRFRSMERALKESNKEFSHMTERELDKLWENVKEKE